jgi:hypothetical protein
VLSSYSPTASLKQISIRTWLIYFSVLFFFLFDTFSVPLWPHFVVNKLIQRTPLTGGLDRPSYQSTFLQYSPTQPISTIESSSSRSSPPTPVRPLTARVLRPPSPPPAPVPPTSLLLPLPLHAEAAAAPSLSLRATAADLPRHARGLVG